MHVWLSTEPPSRQHQVLGLSLAYLSMSKQIGISIGTPSKNVPVRAIIGCAQKETRQRHENELLSRFEQAIEALISQGKKVTAARVSQIVGGDHRVLERCPHMKELFLFLR